MALVLAAAGCVAAGALVGAEQVEKERKKQWMQALRTALPEQQQDGWLLSVRVESAELAPELAEQNFKVGVKLGEKRRSLSHWTPAARSSSDGTLTLSSTCHFPWQPETLAPRLRLRLDRVDMVGRTVAREELMLSEEEGKTVSPWVQEYEVLLFSRSGRFAGHLRLVAELRRASSNELRRRVGDALGLGRHPTNAPQQQEESISTSSTNSSTDSSSGINRSIKSRSRSSSIDSSSTRTSTSSSTSDGSGGSGNSGSSGSSGSSSSGRRSG